MKGMRFPAFRNSMGSALPRINEKPVSAQQFLLEQRALTNKRTFLTFCEHFENTPLNNLLNDHVLITKITNLVNKEGSIVSRAFQLAMEATYCKRTFNETILQKHFENDFIVTDVFGVNNGVSSQADIFSAICLKIVSNQIGYAKKDAILMSTPLKLTKELTKQDSIKEKMDYYSSMTDNTAPDALLHEVPYDFKNTKDISYLKNNIYFLETGEFTIGLMTNCIRALKQQIDLHEKSAAFATERKTREAYENAIAYGIKIKQKLDMVEKKTAENIRDAFIDINKEMLHSTPPEHFRMAKFVVKEEQPNLLDNVDIDIIKKVPLDPGNLDTIKARKAIMGILSPIILHDKECQRKIYEITKGSFGANVDDNVQGPD